MSRLSQVLLFDSDSRGRDILSYGFEGEGVAVRATGEVEAALTLIAQSPPPEVLLVVLRGTEDAGWAFTRRLAADPALSALPRLLLAASAELPGDLASVAGSSSFLSLPAFVRDVITAAKVIVASPPVSSPAPGGEQPSDAAAGSQLVGTLSEYGLLFLVRTMVGLKRSGIIQVERSQRQGELRFVDGDLVSAEVGSLQGQAALHQLLLWEEAALDIRFRSIPRRGQSFPQGDELLDDTERFLRDFAHATKNIGQAQSLFVQDADKVASLVDAIPAEVLPVMKLFDGQRNLGDVLEDSPFRAFETLEVISRLLDMGIVRRKAIEKPSTGLPPTTRRPRADEAPAPALRANEPAAPPVPAASLALRAGPVPQISRPIPGSTGEGNASSSHRRRSRRRTGEVPLLSGGAVPQAAFVHGELRSEQTPSFHPTDDMPKVLVDLGPTLEAEPLAVLPAPEPGAATVAPPAADPAANVITPPPVVTAPDPEPAAAASDGGERNGHGVPEGRLTGVASAEINTGLRPAPAPELLATPGSGPSIMLDPNLVAEMDAFELANTAATPPPAVTAPPPAVTAPAPATPPAAETPRPAPRPAAPAAVVSFVHGTNPGPSNVTLNSAPTVPITTVGGPAAAATGGAAAGSARGPAPSSGESAPRRGSGEWDALEADFFARESELYRSEPTESFDDLDPATGKRRSGS